MSLVAVILAPLAKIEASIAASAVKLSWLNHIQVLGCRSYFEIQIKTSDYKIKVSSNMRSESDLQPAAMLR